MGEAEILKRERERETVSELFLRTIETETAMFCGVARVRTRWKPVRKFYHTHDC